MPPGQIKEKEANPGKKVFSDSGNGRKQALFSPLGRKGENSPEDEPPD